MLYKSVLWEVCCFCSSSFSTSPCFPHMNMYIVEYFTSILDVFTSSHPALDPHRLVAQWWLGALTPAQHGHVLQHCLSEATPKEIFAAPRCLLGHIIQRPRGLLSLKKANASPNLGNEIPWYFFPSPVHRRQATNIC